MTKRGSRTTESDTRRVLIKRAYEILRIWAEDNYSDRRWPLVKASVHYLKKQNRIQETDTGELVDVKEKEHRTEPSSVHR